MSPSKEHLNTLLDHYNNGRFNDAENLARFITSRFPSHQFAWKVLGVVLKQTGRLTEALTFMRKSVQIAPHDAEAHNNLGVALQELDNFEEAEVSYKQAIALQPDYAEAYNNLGVALQKLNKLEEAKASYNQAIQLNSDYAEAHSNLGTTLQELGKLEHAISSYSRAIELKSSYAQAHLNLGNTLQELGRLEKAEASYKQAINLEPNYAKAYTNLGNTLKKMGRFIEAEANCTQAITLEPDYAEAYNNLGNTLQELSRLEEAEANYMKAIALKPNLAEAHSNLANTLQELGRLEEAEVIQRRAIELNPEFAEAYTNLGNTLQRLGRLEHAVLNFNKSIVLKPNYHNFHSNKNLCLNYSSLWSPRFIYEEHCKFEQQFGGIEVRTSLNLANYKHTGDKLRIGYVSGDFKNHSVTYFFEPLLQNHNSNIIETFCYYNNTVIDEVTNRLKATSNHWCSIYGVSDKDVVTLIKRDKIDILVDLSGHTGKNRLLVFTKKPAPIQVSWLGYVNTTGLVAMDYRFTDSVADPIGEADNLYSEKLLRLPNGFQCYKGDETLNINLDLPQKKKGYITFGSFNNLLKVTPEVIKAWSKILHNVPNSILLLKSSQLNQDIGHYLENLNNEGISNDRVKVYGMLPNKKDHLKLYNNIDIGLDTFPFNGATTTCEALWMGVPVITIVGDRHVARVGASILTNVGLKDFIADNIDGYIELASKMSGNIDYLQRIRQGLRAKMLESSLCNGKSFAKDIESAYQNMWRDYLLEVG